MLAFAGVTPVVPVSLGEESPVALPLSEPPLGMWTFSRGRAPLMMLLEREGTGTLGREDVETVR